MQVAEILHEIEALPSADQAMIFARLRELAEVEVPESLRESMAQAERGELIELDQALEAHPVAEPDFVARARRIWGDHPGGKPLSEIVAESRD